MTEHNELNNYINQKFDKLTKNINKKISNRCFTCKPRGVIKKHIIGTSLCGNYLFHHDMNHRPIILVTPKKHIINIEEIENKDELFKIINNFCNFWNIKDYQLSFNYGSWKTNEHFHIKIKINDKIIERMRGDHFRRLKLQENYK